jgi:archaellum biogenesis ATPase FlaH
MFEFSGLRDDGYTVFTSVRGYEQGQEVLTVSRDIDDVTLTLAVKQRP